MSAVALVRADAGPVLPSRGIVQAQAREIERLAKRAIEFAGTGPTANLQLALRQFDHMREILGGGDG